MGSGEMNARRTETSALLVVALMLTCVNRQPQAPVVSAVEPDSVVEGVSVSVTIRGTFHFDYYADFQDGSQARLGTEFSARLDDTGLEDVRWFDTTEIVATVPASLAVGVYELAVEDPAGRVGRLAAAFEIVGCTHSARADPR